MPSPPASLERVYAALCALQPRSLFSEADTSRVRRELLATAYAMARAADYWEQLQPALLLFGSELLERWEALLGVGVHAEDSRADRVARLLPLLRRRLSYSRDRLAAVLAPLLGVPPTSLVWIEVLRAEIESAMTATRAFSGGGAAVVAGASPGFVFVVDTPWPSVVDDFGVALYVDIDVVDPADITVRVAHSSGKAWIAQTADPAPLALRTIFARTQFEGLVARGPWRIEVDTTGGSGAAKVKELRLLVSNVEDSAQIYTSYCLRDVVHGVLTPVAPAQRMLQRAGIAHVLSRVVERDQVLCDDAHSLTDREPVGS